MLKMFHNLKIKKIFAVTMVVLSLCCVLAITSFAAETAVDTSETIVTGITSIFQQVASNFSFTNLIKFIGIAIGSASVIALGWFGLRKVVKMIQSALMKGRVSV